MSGIVKWAKAVLGIRNKAEGPKQLKERSRDMRPAEFFDQFHERARNKGVNPTYRIVWTLLWPVVVLFYRTEHWWVERVPTKGPLIFSCNHHSNMDHFLIALRAPRPVRFLAKSELFSGIVGWIISHGGVFPVRRGWKDREWLVTGLAVLARGEDILMYHPGGRARPGDGDKAKPGVGELALVSGTPVVAVYIHNSEHVREGGLPPRITVCFDKPVNYGLVDNPSDAAKQLVADDVKARVDALQADFLLRWVRGERPAWKQGAVRVAIYYALTYFGLRKLQGMIDWAAKPRGL